MASELSEIDMLMSLDPLELTKDPKALEAIIAYYRNQRVKQADGPKPKRGKPAGPAAPLNLAALGLGSAEPKEDKPKPVGGGIRRI
jgi:hypothetical protein